MVAPMVARAFQLPRRAKPSDSLRHAERMRCLPASASIGALATLLLPAIEQVKR